MRCIVNVILYTQQFEHTKTHSLCDSGTVSFSWKEKKNLRVMETIKSFETFKQTIT